jgi:hypothetical protein
MKIFITHPWDNGNKLVPFFSIKRTAELGLSFRNVKVHTGDTYTNVYYFTLSLLFIKIIVNFNPLRRK